MYTATAPSFRTTATAVAASMLGTALIFATPQAAQAGTRADFVRDVEMQLKSDRFAPSDLNGTATIAVRVDADGKVLSADVAGPSGNTALDQDALVTAKGVAYPKGSGIRTIAVVMTYGKVATKPTAEQSARLVNRYVNAKGEALAQNPASPVG